MPVRRMQQPAVEPLTLVQAKQHLRVDFDDDDELITDLISVARETAEDRTSRALILSRWRLTVDAFSPALELPNPPCLSVQSVTFFDVDGVQRTLDPADYFVDTVSEPAYIVPAAGRSWPATQDRINAIVVEYSAGYGAAAADVPKPVVQWIKLAMTDLYDNRSLSADKPQVPQNFADSLLDVYKMVVV